MEAMDAGDTVCTKRKDQTTTITQAELCELASSIGRDKRLTEVLDFRRPPMKTRANASRSIEMDDTQLDAMYAVAGCADVANTLSAVSKETRALLWTQYGIDKMACRVWFKNRRHRPNHMREKNEKRMRERERAAAGAKGAAPIEVPLTPGSASDAVTTIAASSFLQPSHAAVAQPAAGVVALPVHKAGHLQLVQLASQEQLIAGSLGLGLPNGIPLGASLVADSVAVSSPSSCPGMDGSQQQATVLSMLAQPQGPMHLAPQALVGGTSSGALPVMDSAQQQWQAMQVPSLRGAGAPILAINSAMPLGLPHAAAVPGHVLGDVIRRSISAGDLCNTHLRADAVRTRAAHVPSAPLVPASTGTPPAVPAQPGSADSSATQLGTVVNGPMLIPAGCRLTTHLCSQMR